jgi:hypothetical protein
MSRRTLLTPAVQANILAYIRAGGFPEVAAEAAGVRADVFARWRERGESAGARPRYRAFARAVRQAAAQARLGAELSVRQDKPFDWLRYGPGRETARSPGWTSAARPRAAAAEAPTLAHPAVQRLAAAVLAALADFPEARAHAAGLLAGLTQA